MRCERLVSLIFPFLLTSPHLPSYIDDAARDESAQVSMLEAWRLQLGSTRGGCSHLGEIVHYALRSQVSETVRPIRSVARKIRP
jgi:hypothetical protein